MRGFSESQRGSRRRGFRRDLRQWSTEVREREREREQEATESWVRRGVEERRRGLSFDPEPSVSGFYR